VLLLLLVLLLLVLLLVLLVLVLVLVLLVLVLLVLVLVPLLPLLLVLLLVLVLLLRVLLILVLLLVRGEESRSSSDGVARRTGGACRDRPNDSDDFQLPVLGVGCWLGRRRRPSYRRLASRDEHHRQPVHEQLRTRQLRYQLRHLLQELRRGNWHPRKHSHLSQAC
jgi:hypothetical protein